MTTQQQNAILQLIQSKNAFLHQSTTGTLTKLLQAGITVEVDEVNEQGEEIQKKVNRQPTLAEVMLDPDFLVEAKMSNELLWKFMTRAQVLKMIDFLVVEPGFDDDAQRCFQLPQLACECFTSEQMGMFVCHLFDEKEIQSGKLEVFDKLFSFFDVPDPSHKKDSRQLNPTLGGFINKIISFWLIKAPQIILKYVTDQQRRCQLIDQMFNHLYLSHCVTDLLVRLCTVPSVPAEVDICDYHDMRNDILQHCINGLDSHMDDEFLTAQVFDILTTITKKCYIMIEPQTFFEELMSPFHFMPLLQFTLAQAGPNTNQGATFLEIFFWNLFVAEPDDSKLDVTEINFGFQITSVGGVELNKNQAEDEEETKEKEEEVQEVAASAQGESTAMKQEQLLRQKLIGGKTKLYQKSDLQLLIAQQISSSVCNFEMLLEDELTPMMTRLQLFELIGTLLDLNNEMISESFSETPRLFSLLIQDYERFDSNSVVLKALNKLFSSITWQVCNQEIVKLLYVENRLLEKFARRFSLSEFKVKPILRKDIYAFIQDFVENLRQDLQTRDGYFKSIIGQLEPHWTVLCKVTESNKIDSDRNNWCKLSIQKETKPAREADQVVVHEPNKKNAATVAGAKGTHDTTKKIITNSLAARQKLTELDDVINQ